jgi:DprA winged helix domain
MDESRGRLRAAGRKKVGPGDPLLVLACDELAYYLGGRGGREFGDALRDLVQRGRALGLVVLAATQKHGDVVPTALRDLFGYRVAFRATTSAASDVGLGAGWAAEGYDASTIPAGQRGTAYLLAEGALPARVRTYLLGDADVEALAARSAALLGTPATGGVPPRAVGAPGGSPPRSGGGGAARRVAREGGAPPPPEGGVPRPAPPRRSADAEVVVLEHLSEWEPVSAKALARKTGVPETTLRRQLGRLAVQGRARQVGGGDTRWLRAPAPREEGKGPDGG